MHMRNVAIGFALLASSPAFAAELIVNTVAALPSSTTWGTLPGENTGGGARTAVTSTVARSGTGSLELFGDRARAQIGIQYNPVRTNLGNLSSAQSLTFDWRIAGDSTNPYNADYTPALRLLFQDAGTSTRKELIWEGAYNNVYGNVLRDKWYTSSATDLFYVTGGSVNEGRTIAAWASIFDPRSTISGFSVGVGSGATAGYHAFADNVTFATSAGSSTYNFEQAALIPEPATWAMMIIGFGGIGGALRSAKRRSGQKLGSDTGRASGSASA